jgi:hypothetical protein
LRIRKGELSASVPTDGMDDRIPGVVIHRGPPLLPDDVTTVDGIR